MDTETKLIPKTFFWMFLGLLGTAIISWYTYSSGLFARLIAQNYWPILLIVEVVVVLLFSFLFRKLSPTVVGILYFVYAALNGVTLSFTALIIGIVLSVINIFLGNSTLDIILDWVILLIFFGITIYDMNNIKNLQYEEGINQEKLYIYGAMQLYLDFINIFIRILSIFGDTRD